MFGDELLEPDMWRRYRSQPLGEMNAPGTIIGSLQLTAEVILELIRIEHGDGNITTPGFDVRLAGGIGIIDDETCRVQPCGPLQRNDGPGVATRNGAVFAGLTCLPPSPPGIIGLL